MTAVQVLNISHPTGENAQNYVHAGQKQAGLPHLFAAVLQCPIYGCQLLCQVWKKSGKHIIFKGITSNKNSQSSHKWLMWSHLQQIMQPCYNSIVHRTRTGERLYWKINRIKPCSSVLSSWLQFCQLYGHPQFQIPQYNLKRNNFVSKFHEWLLMNLLWATNSYKWATTTFFIPLLEVWLQHSMFGNGSSWTP